MDGSRPAPHLPPPRAAELKPSAFRTWNSESRMRENRLSGLMRGGEQTVIGHSLSIRRFLPTLPRITAWQPTPFASFAASRAPSLLHPPCAVPHADHRKIPGSNSVKIARPNRVKTTQSVPKLRTRASAWNIPSAVSFRPNSHRPDPPVLKQPSQSTNPSHNSAPRLQNLDLTKSMLAAQYK
jgi:hypothetical protein